MCTMRPHPRAIMPPKTALVNSIGDSRPVSIPERQSSEVMPLQSGVYGGGEQVATRMSGSGQASRISRSEEHTSELQSLMRSSYAVFCLQTNNTTQTITNKHNRTRAIP